MHYSLTKCWLVQRWPFIPMTKIRTFSMLALPSLALLLTACGGGSSGGTQSTNPDGLHEPPPESGDDSTTDISDVSPPVGEAVSVGIADTGFRLTHETLAPYWSMAANLSGNSADVSGNADHGTAVSSLVTQTGTNTELLLSKVSDPDDPDLAAQNVLDYSVGFLASEGARIINHSWSGRLEAPDPSASYQGIDSLESLKQITSSNDGLGSVYVVAAGNEGEALQATNPIHQYSDIFERMLIVGGSTLDENGERVLDPQSNHPGDDDLWQSRFVTAPWEVRAATSDADNSYAYWGGTSVAAPQVAVYAAAIIERWPHLDAVEVSKHLLDTADKSSSLYQRNTCGESGTLNCGYFYLGQGEADVLAALEPAGTLVLPTGTHVGGGSVDAEQSVAELSGAYGDSLSASGALANVAAFDDLGRDYYIDLTKHSQSRYDRGNRMRDHMEQLSVTSPEQRQQHSATQGAFSFSSTLNGYGDTLSSRFDGQIGASQWTAFHFAGSEVDPLSAYSQSAMMPLLAYQGGSAFTEGVEAVSGLRSQYALTDQLALVAKHWAGEGGDDASSMRSDYAVNRTDVGLHMALNESIGVTSTVGVLNEEQGLLGAQGSGALSLGEDNRTSFASLTVDASLGNDLTAFAHYEQGRGDVEGSGIIQRISGIQTGEMGLGLQWTGERHQAAFGYRQPMRLEDATATLSVPVGRTNDGQVIRETRQASLAPSGRQQDFEIGYTFLPSQRSALQFNLLHTIEPGHDGDAPSDTAFLANYRVAF